MVCFPSCLCLFKYTVVCVLLDSSVRLYGQLCMHSRTVVYDCVDSSVFYIALTSISIISLLFKYLFIYIIRLLIGVLQCVYLACIMYCNIG